MEIEHIRICKKNKTFYVLYAMDAIKRDLSTTSNILPPYYAFVYPMLTKSVLLWCSSSYK